MMSMMIMLIRMIRMIRSNYEEHIVLEVHIFKIYHMYDTYRYVLDMSGMPSPGHIYIYLLYVYICIYIYRER